MYSEQNEEENQISKATLNIFWKHFCKPFFDQAENGMFLPDRKKYDFTFICRRPKFSKSRETLIITRDIDRDHSSVEMNKWSDQDRCRQTTKVIMSGFLHQKTFVTISFTTQISSFLKNDLHFLSFYILSNSSEISLPIYERLSIFFEKFIIYRPTASPSAGVVLWVRSRPWLAL